MPWGRKQPVGIAKVGIEFQKGRMFRLCLQQHATGGSAHGDVVRAIEGVGTVLVRRRRRSLGVAVAIAIAIATATAEVLRSAFWQMELIRIEASFSMWGGE